MPGFEMWVVFTCARACISTTTWLLEDMDMCANKSVSVMDVCCYGLFLSKILFFFLSGNPEFCISSYGGECKACKAPLSLLFLSSTCSCFSHEATACLMFHVYSFYYCPTLQSLKEKQTHQEAKLKIPVQGKLLSKTI